MSKAYKCDRCKKPFLYEEGDENFYYNIPQMWVIEGKDANAESAFGTRRFSDNLIELDFCKECSAKFKEFLYGPKEDKDEGLDILDYTNYREYLYASQTQKK